MAIATSIINQQNEPSEQADLIIPVNKTQLLDKQFSKYTTDDWKYISQYVVLCTDFILRFIDKLDIILITQYQKIDLDAFIKIIYRINFEYGFKKYCMSCYIERKSRYLRYPDICYDTYSGDCVCRKECCNCSDEKFWDNISRYQNLTKKFIDVNYFFLNWDIVFEHQQIDEKIIEGYSKYINYMITYSKYINYKLVINYKLLSKNTEICDMLCKFIDWRDIDIGIKKRYVEKYYETFDVNGKIWIKCYKSVKKDYSSIYSGKKWTDVIMNKPDEHINFIYDKINMQYNTSCDFDPTKANSFGFGCWTYEMASKYAESNKIKDYKIIDVIVPLESSCMIDDGKLRSSEMIIVKI